MSAYRCQNRAGVRCACWTSAGSTITIEVTGQTHEIDEFMEQIEQFDILEMARTGINALERGDSTIHDDD